MATLAIPINQMRFPFMPSPAPLPTEMHCLKPIVLQPGKIGNTIRRIGKWVRVSKGHIIDLTDGPDHKFVGTGRIVKIWTAPFKDVLAKVLDRNHAGSQSYSSVLTSLRNAYGADFSENEIVVFLDYKRIN